MTSEASSLVVAIIVMVFVSFIISWTKKRKLKLPPGPAGFPIVGYLPFLGKEPYKTFLKLSRKYKSDIIGLYLGNKYTVVLSEYEIMKEALSHPSAQDRSTETFDAIPELGFAVQNGDQWVYERRLTMGIVKELGIGLGNWERLMQDEIECFLKELSSYNGRPIVVSDMVTSSVIRNFIGLLFGRLLEKGKEDEKIKLLNEYSEVIFSNIAPVFLTTFFKGMRKIFQLLKVAGYDKFVKTIHGFRNIVKEEIENHKKGKVRESAIDFIKLFQEAIAESQTTKNNRTVSENALVGNANAIYLGASDTTSSSMRWLLYLLALHPDVQKQMQKEIDEVLGAVGVPSYFERDKIPYTFAVLMEAQRYSSLLRLSPARRASSDFTIRGYTIPKGSDIIGNIWALHNDPKYWPEPEKFNPERFLMGPEKKLNKNPESYAVFSFGRRRCPGNVIAWMEILAYSTSILKKFDIVMPPESNTQWDVVYGLVNHLKMKPLCFVQRKK